MTVADAPQERFSPSSLEFDPTSRACIKDMPNVIREGFMVRYGRRKIGRTFFHKRYFVLEPRLLSYYKKKPSDNEVPIKSLSLDGNCRVEDRGMESHHGHGVYVISVYDKKDKSNHITMASFKLQEATLWKEAIEQVIDQYPHMLASIGNIQGSRFEIKPTLSHEQKISSVDGENKSPLPQGDENNLNYDQANAIDLPDTDGSNDVDPRSNAHAPGANGYHRRKRWRLVRCQNGLRIFNEIPDDITNNSKTMKAVGVVEAKCEDIFSLIMGMDETRNEWDSTFHDGMMVEEVNGHAAILYQRLQLDWCNWLVWPRDICYMRYWRRTDNGVYVIALRSTEHIACPPQPGCVRAHIESGGFTISPLKPRPGSGVSRARVEHQVHIDLRGWGVGYLPFFQQHCILQMLNCVAGLREWFAQSDESQSMPQFNRIIKLESQLKASEKDRRHPLSVAHVPSEDVRQLDDDESDDEDEGQASNQEVSDEKPTKEYPAKSSSPTEVDTSEDFDRSAFSSSIPQGDPQNGRNCWSIPHGNNFRVRSRLFPFDKSKIPAGESLLQLVSVDWFKHTERMDHIARRKGCAAQVAAEKGLFTLLFNLQVPASMHYSMVLYFLARKPIDPRSLLQRFIDGDDGFRSSRLKLIPSVPKGSWIVRQSVGSTPCILGKALDCNYHRGKKYLEVDVDIGSSSAANGVLGLVFGVVSSLIVDMAFLIQGNSVEELPERLIGTVRISRLELSKAISPGLDTDLVT